MKIVNFYLTQLGGLWAQYSAPGAHPFFEAYRSNNVLQKTLPHRNPWCGALYVDQGVGHMDGGVASVCLLLTGRHC